jgi:D-tyrosyl-tRNA(Tyr) deacylase
MVSIENRIVSSIRRGILIFLGVEKGDTPQDAEYLMEKIVNLRIFEDESGKMNRSLLDIAGEMMVISQFTLLADCRKGRRPSFVQAEEPGEAKKLYEIFVARCKDTLLHVATGEFQAMMKIDSVNDGPVTILLDSRKRF